MTEPWSNQATTLVVIQAQPGVFSGLFLYSGPPALGNLITSIAASAGTDPFGNPYPVDIGIGGVSAPQVHLYVKTGQGVLEFPTNADIEQTISAVKGAIIGAAGHRFLQLSNIGPNISVANHHDQVQYTLNSADEDGTSFANWQWQYLDDAATVHIYGFMDGSGVQILAGRITAVDPTTGTSALNPAITETWHDLGTPAATGYNSVRRLYRLDPDNNEVEFDIQLVDAGTGTAGLYTYANTLPAVYRPAIDRFYPLGAQGTWIAAGARSPGLKISTAGIVTLHVPTIGVAGNLVGGNVRMPRD